MAERQWATVREDYSADGDAWSREYTYPLVGQNGVN